MTVESKALVRAIEGELVEAGDGPTALELAGQVANRAASANLFADYRARKSASTRRAQDAALALFVEYLDAAGVVVDAGGLATGPAAWRGVTWGLVKGFVRWQLKRGYAVSSINSRLSHVKVYAGLANQVGALSEGELVKIQGVSGYGGSERARVNETRQELGLDTRIGAKKASPVLLTDDQAARLMGDHPDTPQGRRDAVLCHLALKHGLRVSELSALQVGDFTLARDKAGKVVSGVMRFYRPKLAGTPHEWGEHTLTNGTLSIVTAYLDSDAPAVGPLFRSSRKGGKLTTAGVTRRSLSVRIKSLGERLANVEGLTAHDCRHYAATRDGNAGKSVKYMMSKYGWTSAQTAMRYTHQDGPVVVE